MIGQRFGKLIVIERSRKSNGDAAWLCQCDCGGTILATTSGLNKKDNTSCGCLKGSGRTLKDITGEVFSNLTVLKREGTSGAQTTWLCECTCGKKRIVQRSNLILGKVISCGCITLSMKSIIERLYNKVKYNAEIKREISFTLNLEEFQTLVLSDCYYCGTGPSLTFKTKKEKIKYGGIDRMINEEGYYINNCVPCCWHCNNMKNHFSYQDFINKVHLIAQKHPL